MKHRLLLLCLICFVSAGLLSAQRIIITAQSVSDLPAQFKSVFESGKSSGPFWIGYSVNSDEDYQFFVGSYYSDNNTGPSLREIISNPGSYRGISSKRSKIYGRTDHFNFRTSIHHKNGDKETAILFLYRSDSQNINDFDEIVVCNLALAPGIDNYPLTWLGKAENKNSFNFLTSLFKKSGSNTLRKELISAIGIHSDLQEVTSFLNDIIHKGNNDELRKNCVFWLGFQNNNESLRELKNIVKSDPSLEIRKNAVFAFSNSKLPAATDELVNIARHNSNDELRKNAAYGLGNKAVAEAEKALKDIIENDPDIEIKKSAVYALANNSGDAVPYLINIARSNKSLSIRKAAIWSLGNSEDKRAVDALIELAQHK